MRTLVGCPSCKSVDNVRGNGEDDGEGGERNKYYLICDTLQFTGSVTDFSCHLTRSSHNKLTRNYHRSGKHMVPLKVTRFSGRHSEPW